MVLHVSYVINTLFRTSLLFQFSLLSNLNLGSAFCITNSDYVNHICMHHAFQPQIQNQFVLGKLNSMQYTAVTFMSAPGENCELEDSILYYCAYY